MISRWVLLTLTAVILTAVSLALGNLAQANDLQQNQYNFFIEDQFHADLLVPRSEVQREFFGLVIDYSTAVLNRPCEGCSPKREAKIQERIIKLLNTSTADDRLFYLVSVVNSLLSPRHLTTNLQWTPEKVETLKKTTTRLLFVAARFGMIDKLSSRIGRPIVGAYQCSKPKIYLDFSLAPLNLAAVVLHELNHLLIDRWQGGLAHDSMSIEQSILVEESMSSLTAAMAQTEFGSRSPGARVTDSLQYFNKRPDSHSRAAYRWLADPQYGQIQWLPWSLLLHPKSWQGIFSVLSQFYFGRQVTVDTSKLGTQIPLSYLPLLQIAESGALLRLSFAELSQELRLIEGVGPVTSSRCLSLLENTEPLRRLGYRGLIDPSTKSGQKPILPGGASVKTDPGIQFPGGASVKTDSGVMFPCLLHGNDGI